MLDISTITTSKALREQIQLLEDKCLQEEYELRDLTRQTLISLKPMNIIKDKFSGTFEMPTLNKSFVATAIGLGIGALTKKVFLRGSHNIFKKAIGAFVELGVAKAVVNNADTIKSKGVQIISKVLK